MLKILSVIENFATEVIWLKMLLKQIITPEILKQPTVVILLMFFVSVKRMVNVGKRPMKRTTIAGKTLKDITKNKTNKNTF